VADALCEALFFRPQDAKVLPVDPDDACGEEEPLVDLVFLMDGDGFDTDSMAI
jgi:hypothetical protein